MTAYLDYLLKGEITKFTGQRFSYFDEIELRAARELLKILRDNLVDNIYVTLSGPTTSQPEKPAYKFCVHPGKRPTGKDPRVCLEFRPYKSMGSFYANSIIFDKPNEALSVVVPLRELANYSVYRDDPDKEDMWRTYDFLVEFVASQSKT